MINEITLKKINEVLKTSDINDMKVLKRINRKLYFRKFKIIMEEQEKELYPFFIEKDEDTFVNNIIIASFIEYKKMIAFNNNILFKLLESILVLGICVSCSVKIMDAYYPDGNLFIEQQSKTDVIDEEYMETEFSNLKENMILHINIINNEDTLSKLEYNSEEDCYIDYLYIKNLKTNEYKIIKMYVPKDEDTKEYLLNNTYSVNIKNDTEYDIFLRGTRTTYNLKNKNELIIDKTINKQYVPYIYFSIILLIDFSVVLLASLYIKRF